MSPLPSISILVMSYNQEKYIADCVHSVLCQEYDGELEFIFCDDHSTDRSFDIIQECVCKYTGNRRVVTHRCEKNGRVAVNMNVAVQLSKNDWLMRVDGDDILHPDRTRLTALAIQKHPNAAAISGKLVPFSSEIKEVRNVSDDELIFKVYNKSDITPCSVPAGLEWWGCMMCLSRKLFSVFGNIPAECYTLDDTLFAARALMLGDFVIIENGILLYYRRHEANISSECLMKNSSLHDYIKHDAASRNYYHRGILSHQPILSEIELYVDTHPECKIVYEYFNNRFCELRRQAHFWKKSWKERIADARITGPFWKKIPWAIRVICPFTYALAAKYVKKS